MCGVGRDLPADLDAAGGGHPGPADRGARRARSSSMARPVRAFPQPAALLAVDAFAVPASREDRPAARRRTVPRSTASSMSSVFGRSASVDAHRGPADRSAASARSGRRASTSARAASSTRGRRSRSRSRRSACSTAWAIDPSTGRRRAAHRRVPPLPDVGRVPAPGRRQPRDHPRHRRPGDAHPRGRLRGGPDSEGVGHGGEVLRRAAAACADDPSPSVTHLDAEAAMVSGPVV